MTMPKRQVLAVIMDGIGISKSTFGNAVANAVAPNLRWLMQETAYRTVFAHGTHVGLTTDSDLGNSEVGHNAFGAGRVFDQGAKLVQKAISSGDMYVRNTWKQVMQQTIRHSSTLHFLGLLSDGNVHSHETHLYDMLKQAKKEGVKKIRLHVLLDGRDVGEKSAEIYISKLETVMASLSSAQCDIAIGSGGGRMQITMDRYEADWSMVERGWHAHVHGQATYKFKSISEAIAYFRQDPLITDQYIPAFVIEKDEMPCGKIISGDAVVFFNFRGDRAIEISRAFTEEPFNKFDRNGLPDVYFAGMMEYDGDLKIPKNFLVSPPVIDNTLGEYLAQSGVRQFACSETQKFGHVTYFWNGNRSGYFDKNVEEYLEIPSDNVRFDSKPWMKAFDVTEATIQRMQQKTFDFGRINFANGDMVGHTGNYEAAVVAVEVIDLMLGKLIAAARETNTILIVTADHGNAEEMFEGKESFFPDWQKLPLSKRPTPKNAHTINPVPFCVFDPLSPGPLIMSPLVKDACLGNVANTVLHLLGLPSRDIYLPSLIERV